MYKILIVLSFQFGMKIFTKSSTQSFEPTSLNFKQDVCQLVNLGAQKVLFMLSPPLKIIFEKIAHPCPYSVTILKKKKNKLYFSSIDIFFFGQGRVEIKDFVVDSVDDSMLLKVLQRGEYKIVHTFYNGNDNKTIFVLEVLSLWKGTVSGK
jgi:hypothetical protein